MAKRTKAELIQAIDACAEEEDCDTDKDDLRNIANLVRNGKWNEADAALDALDTIVRDGVPEWCFRLIEKVISAREFLDRMEAR